MSEAPPAYSEAPTEDLVAELAKMKAMMEQMRLEKERLEMEAKRKAEEAAATLRAKQEVEATVKLQKEKKELDAIFQQFQNHVVRTPDLRFENPSAYTFGKNEKQLLTMIENSGETILSVGFSTHIVYGNPDTVTIQYQSGIYPNVQSRGISLILTNRQLYGVYYNTDKAEYCENTYVKTLIKMGHNMSFQCVSLYQFSEPLNIKYATMLLYILKTPSYNKCSSNSIWNYVSMLEPSDIDGNSSNTILKRFESVIRLIPGSYKNGDWRQLDGFFGTYFNETTMEFSEVPPPSL
jgi:hypothetical protein|uniref:Uncharacterized protein n=1 Tax=viral metagenome TaxID=1070528 RepID=A0A6C0BHZ1_9ZZZZ